MCLVFSIEELKSFTEKALLLKLASAAFGLEKIVTHYLKSVFGQCSIRYVFMFQIKHFWQW